MPFSRGSRAFADPVILTRYSPSILSVQAAAVNTVTEAKVKVAINGFGRIGAWQHLPAKISLTPRHLPAKLFFVTRPFRTLARSQRRPAGRSHLATCADELWRIAHERRRSDRIPSFSSSTLFQCGTPFGDV